MSNYQNEKREAIQAGVHAIDSLERARDLLEKASHWGLFDIFGGGIFVSLMKHNRISEAQNYLNDAKYDLEDFVKQLADIHVEFPIDVNFNEIFTLADVFMDNIVVDIMAQRKIKQAMEDIDHMIFRIEELLRKLQ